MNPRHSERRENHPVPWLWIFYIFAGFVVFAGLIHMGPGIIAEIIR